MRARQILPLGLPWAVLVLLGCMTLGAACESPAAEQPAATLTSLQVAPPQVSLTPPATQQFTAGGQWSDGSSTAPAVTWTATGGTISVDGLYTPGTVVGTYRVVATQQAGTIADTAQVIILAPPPNTYTTTFAVTENPLSEGGKWIHLDSLLTGCQSVGGQAFGTQTASSGYDDSNCYLTGYGANYEIQGTVWLNPGLSGQANREIEILVRWTDDNAVRSTPYGDTHASSTKPSTTE